MIIKRTRINSVDKYLEFIGETEEFFVCVPNSDSNQKVLKEKRVCSRMEDGMQFVPNTVGAITRYNINGKKIVRKDLEKEPRIIEHDFHIVDWHGKDHYRTCYQTRMCHPRELLLPPCESIIIDGEIIRLQQ